MHPFSSSAFLCKKTFHEKIHTLTCIFLAFRTDTGHKLLQAKKGGTMLHHLSGIHTWPVPAQPVNFLSNGKLVRGFLLLWKEMGKTGLFIIKRKGFDLCPRHFRTGERLHLPWKRKRLFLPRMGHRPNLRPHSPQSPNQTDFGKEVSPVATLNKDSWSKQKLQPDSFFNHLEFITNIQSFPIPELIGLAL